MPVCICWRKVRLGAIHGTITEYVRPRSNDPPVTPVVDFTVEAITTHHLYNHETSQNDVALVRVHGAITFNGNFWIMTTIKVNVILTVKGQWPFRVDTFKADREGWNMFCNNYKHKNNWIQLAKSEVS